MGYRLSKKLDGTQKDTVRRIFRESVKKGHNTTTILNRLSENGVTYRRTNMLRDIRLATASSQAHDTLNRLKAVNWYENVFETFQEAHNLTPKKAAIQWNRIRDESYDTLEEAELGAEWQELYDSLFPSVI